MAASPSTPEPTSDLTVGFLHPGQMGVTLAANATTNGRRLWAGAGRSPATVARAAEAGLDDAGDLGQLCQQCDLIVSICPPGAAEEVAEQVAANDFAGTYLDANAISPQTSSRIGARFGSRYVDGGVIGPPALEPGTTRLYLAGPAAPALAGLWTGSALDARVLTESTEGAKASALKMAYAGWTKGSTALLLTINALASRQGVLDHLREEWDLSQPGLGQRSSRSAAGAGPKAWRWAAEMAEIADTLAAVDLPDGFHRAAEAAYDRLADLKDSADPTLDELIHLLAPGADGA